MFHSVFYGYFWHMKKMVLLFSFFILFKPLWPVVEYFLHYDYIVSELCENRNQPELECDGKCYLSKQIAKESGEGENNPFNQNPSQEIPQFIFYESFPEFNFAFLVPPLLKQYTEIKPDFYHLEFHSNLLDPPQLG